MQKLNRNAYTTIVGTIFALIGLGVGLAGAWLVSLGGSLYYLVAGLMLLWTGWLVRRRSTLALWVFAALFAGSLAWSLWEIGVDWWPLAARMGVLFLLGVWLLLPWTTRRLGVPKVITPATAATSPASAVVPRTSWRVGGGRVLTAFLALFAFISAGSWLRDVHAIDGMLPPSQGALIDADADMHGVPPGDWQAYGRTGFGQRYSPLAQITPSNVSQLEVAWHIHTGDLRGQPGDPEETTYEVTPLKVGDRLFLCNPHQTVMALDATTGQEIWRYDPKVSRDLALQHLTCRGLSYEPPMAAGMPISATPAATVAGVPVAAIRTSPPRSRPASAIPSIRRTAGPSPASTRSSAWSTCRWATSRPTSGAAIAAL